MSHLLTVIFRGRLPPACSPAGGQLQLLLEEFKLAHEAFDRHEGWQLNQEAELIEQPFAGRKLAAADCSTARSLMMLTYMSSGADQLKEERLRYNATAKPEMVDEQSGCCWDLSSEDEYISAFPVHSQLSDTSEALVASAAGQGADPPAAVNAQQALSCHQHLPQHTALTDAVKQMLQLDGVVRKRGRQSLPGSAPYLHPTTVFCGA